MLHEPTIYAVGQDLKLYLYDEIADAIAKGEFDDEVRERMRALEADEMARNAPTDA